MAVVLLATCGHLAADPRSLAGEGKEVPNRRVVDRAEKSGRPLYLSFREGEGPRVKVVSGVDDLVAASVLEFRQRLTEKHGCNVQSAADAVSATAAKPSVLIIAGQQSDRPFGPYRRYLDPGDLPPQGFMLKRIQEGSRREILLCLGADPLGVRYGLIEILRRIRSDSKGAYLDWTYVRDAPDFPFREVYINLSAHQLNGYNPAVITGDPQFDWSLDQWRDFIDMIAFFRYNWLELWIPPHLFNLEALKGGHPYDRFVRIVNAMARHARTRGVRVDILVPVNCTVGTGHLFNDLPLFKGMPAYTYLCPKVPEEHASIQKIWDHWTKELPEVSAWSLFPGDPGGCMDNGCDATTAVDLYIELSSLIKRNNPKARVFVHIWQWFGWGRDFMTADGRAITRGVPQERRIDRGNEYLLAHLAQFPDDTQYFLNPGDYETRTRLSSNRSLVYIEALSRKAPVTTWTYFVTEGEGWINHAYRIPEILKARREESRLPLSGGISYTMTPRLNLLNLYANAEAYWNPQVAEERILKDFVSGIFGSENSDLEKIFPTYQVAPMVGYTFSGGSGWSPDYAGLRDTMRRNLEILDSTRLRGESRFVTAIHPSEYLQELRYFAALYSRLGAGGLLIRDARASLSELPELAHVPTSSLRFSHLEQAVESYKSRGGSLSPAEKAQAAKLGDLRARIAQLDLKGLKLQYAHKHYSVFFVHPNEFTPLVPGLIDNFFRAFGMDFLEEEKPATGPKAATAKD